MKRRKFFGTLGAGLAGLALLKPTLSESNEIQRVSPIQIKGSPSKSRGTEYTKCRLYHKEVFLTDVQSMELPGFSVTSMYIWDSESGDFSIVPGRKQIDNFTLSGCRHSKKLYKVFKNDEVCTLIIDEGEITITLDVVIIGINNFSDTHCNLKVSPIGEVVIL